MRLEIIIPYETNQHTYNYRLKNIDKITPYREFICK